MKISIITATYNSAATVRDTIESVLAQTHADTELVIIDGLSKDNTLEIVAEYGSRIARVVSERDGGIYDAMNKGIRTVTGDIVGILNSDDYYAHDRVLEHVAALFTETGADAVYADLQYITEDKSRVVRHWRSGRFSRRGFYFGWMPPHPTFFVRRECYEQYGGFDLTLRSAADYELMLRFLIKNGASVAYLPEVTTMMRVGGMSNASLKNRLRANREDREAWRKNGLTPYFFTLWLKPLRKITQFITPALMPRP